MPSQRRRYLVLMIGLLTALALSLGGGAAHAQDAPAASASPGGEVCERSLLRPFVENLGISGADARTVDELGALVADTLPREGGRAGAVELLIATIPDPIDSGHYYDFDRILEAIQVALQTQGLLPDRSWLPWNDVQATTPEEGVRARECRRQVPGVVLFRGERPGSLFVLFLVGETPSWGIHQAALTRALGFLERSAQQNLDPAVARILGPTFSGSAPSLITTIRAWSRGRGSEAPTRVQDFRLISGSATNPSLKDALSSSRASVETVAFHATVIPSDARQCAFFQYLHDDLQVPLHDGTLEGVALLSEALTAYGDAFRPNAPPAVTSNGCPRPALELTFPPRISSVRKAYDAGAAAKAPAAESTASPVAVPVAQLAPVLDEPAEPRDGVPSLSPKTTSAHDLLLSTIMGKLTRRGVRYVGLAATDPADAIFLAQRIRLAAPDVRLFTFASEILYTHPSYESALGGMFVVSPYPFFGTSAYLGGRDGKRHPMFEGEGAEGAFNATLALLGAGADGALADYQPLGSGFALPLWISIVSNGGTWPLALRPYDQTTGFVFVPDATLPKTPPPGDALNVDAELNPPALWQLASLMLSLFVVYNVVGRRRWNRAPLFAPPSPAFLLLAGLDERCHASTPIKQRLYALIAVSVLAATQVYVLLHGVAWLRFVGEGHGLQGAVVPWVLVVLGFVGLGFLLVTLGSALRSWWRAIRDELVAPDQPLPTFLAELGLLLMTLGSGLRDTVVFLVRGTPPEERRWRAFDAMVRGAAVLGAAAGALGWFAWTLFGDTGTATLPVTSRVLFLERSVNLDNGVSPIVPVVFSAACVYVWAICHTSRLRLIDALRVVRTDTPAHTPIGSILGKDAPSIVLFDGRLVRVLETPGLIGRTYVGVMFVLAVIPLCTFILKRLSTLETSHGWLALLGAILVCALAAGSGLVRLIFYWLRLHALLRQLARHPLASAFSRLPPSRARSVGMQLSTMPAQGRDLAVPVQQLRVLRKRLDLLEGEDRRRMSAIITPDLVDTLDARSRDELAEEASGRQVVDRRAHPGAPDLLDQLVTASTAVAGALGPFWYGTEAARPIRAGAVHVEQPAPAPEASETSEASEASAPEGEASEPEGGGASADPGVGLSSGTGLAAYGTGARSSGALAWLRLAEELVATMIALFVERLLRQLRHFLTTVLAGALSLLLVVVSYPFQPRRLLVTFIWVVMGSSVGAGIYIFLQLDRNELLSHIAGTRPGHVTVNRELVLRVVTWGVIPLLGVASAQFPGLSAGLFSWVEPFLKALN